MVSMAAGTIIACPSCGKKFKGRPELRGKKVRCPECDHAFVALAMADDPADEAAPPKKAPPQKAGAAAPVAKAKPSGKPKPSAAATASKPPKFDYDEDEADGENPYGVTHLDMAARCPHCANEMESEDAIICIHCGYNTETREIGKTIAVYAITGSEQFHWLLPGLLCGLALVFLTILCLFFSLALPGMLTPKSWLALLDHESMRMWVTLIALAVMWPTGFFAYRRLIMQPRPKEKKKE